MQGFLVTREPQVQLLQSHTMNKNTTKIGIILFILALAISGILIHHWRSEQKTISINADRYTLVKAEEEIGRRIATEITEHDKIQDINKTLSGTYQEKKRIKTMGELHKEVIEESINALPLCHTKIQRTAMSYTERAYTSLTRKR